MLLRFSSIYFVIHVVIVQTELVCDSPNSNDQKSCRCIVKGSSYPHTAIYLCELANRDYCYVLSSSGEGTASSVTRFFILNLFRTIKSKTKRVNDNHQDPVCQKSLVNPPTNCLSKSMCCVASITTFECEESVCEEPLLTSDAYGHFNSQWKIREHKLRTDGLAMKDSKAVIEMTAGACYYCEGNTVSRLNTIIVLFCDERILGRGHPVIARYPDNQNPKLVFNIRTSHSCYVFDSKTPEKCHIGNRVCRDKTFSCTSKNYKFQLPASASHSISKHTSQTVEYVFGFCAQDVDCSGNKNAMICRKETDGNGMLLQAKSIVNYTGNDQEVVIRPTGFVWRFKRYGGELEAVVVFLCDLDQPADIKEFTMDVQEPVHKLPLMLTIEHRCFCPNSPSECAGVSTPTPRPQYQTTASARPHDSVWTIILYIGLGIAVCFVVIACLAYCYQPTTTPTSSTNGTPQPSSTGASSSSTNSRGTSDRPSTPSSALSWHSALSHLSFRDLLRRCRSLSERGPASETEMYRTVTSDCSPIREVEEPNENTRLLYKKHSTI